jgi:hypothetical protein
LSRRNLRLLRLRRFGSSSAEDVGAMQLQRLARGMSVRTRLRIGKIGGFGARRRALENEEQAKKLSARFRRNPLLERRMIKASKSVQRVWRGYCARKEYQIARLKLLGEE